MDIKELESIKLSDAVKFHDELNPSLWVGDDLDPAVYAKLMDIAQDFMAELLHFPKGSHDDMVDAFVGAIKLAIKGGSASEVISASTNFYQGNY